MPGMRAYSTFIGVITLPSCRRVIQNAMRIMRPLGFSIGVSLMVRSPLDTSTEIMSVRVAPLGGCAGPYGGRGILRIVSRAGIKAEHAHFLRFLAQLGHGLFERAGRSRFDIQEKLIFPGAAVNRAAFDLQQVHAAA